MLQIKKVIKSKGYTVTSLAKKIGMAQVSLSRIINGNPTVETLDKIASALNVDITELFATSENGLNETQLYTKNANGEFVKYAKIVKDFF